MSIEQVTVAGGKYTVINDNGKLTALRNGEPWGRDLVGDQLVYAMMVEIQSLTSILDAKCKAGWQELTDEELTAIWVETDVPILNGTYLNEVAKIAFFEGYKMAEKEWRKKMKDALKARLGVQ